MDSWQPECTGLLGAPENALKLSEADTRRVQASDARQRAKAVRAQGMDVAPPSEIVSKFSNTTADPVSARHKALRDLEDFKRTLGEAGIRRAKGYQKQAEAAAAGADLLLRENTDLEAKLSDLKGKHASLRREAEAAVNHERRKSAVRLQEQLSRLQGPAGFDLLKQENVDLRGRLSGLHHEHGDLLRQAQAAINAAEERARVSEVGRAAAYDLGRRLEAQLSSVMDQASKLHREVAVGPPAAAVTCHGGVAALPSAPALQQHQHLHQHQQQQQQQQQQVPRHLRDIEKWFEGIPERFRGNVRAAKLGKHLKDNVNNKQGLEDAIAEVKKLTIQVSTLIPRSVRSHILRGPEGWASSPPDPPEPGVVL